MPPTASPAALSSSLHRRLWEASGYLLSSLPRAGILRLSPSRPGGGPPSFSSPRGAETPPAARHRPGAVDSGSAPSAPRGRRNLPARRRTRSSRVGQLRRSRRISRQQVPPPPQQHPPQQRCPAPHFSQLGKLAKARRWEVGGRGGRWGWGGVMGKRRLKDFVVCLFVCLSGSLAKTFDHMLKNIGFAQWRRGSGLTLTERSIY